MDCNGGTTYEGCGCKGVAQKVEKDDRFYCCGGSNLRGYRHQGLCERVGWTPTTSQKDINALWVGLGSKVPPVIFTQTGSQGQIDCYDSHPYPLEVTIAEETARICSPTLTNPHSLTNYDTRVKFHEIIGCDYSKGGTNRAVSCGPYFSSSFERGKEIPNPGKPSGGDGGSGGGGGGGGSQPPGSSKPWYEQWWFWLLMALLAAGLGVGIYFAYKANEETKKALKQAEGEERELLPY